MGRRLKQEEHELWHKVTQGIDPIQSARRDRAAIDPAPAPAPKAPRPQPHAPLPPTKAFTIGGRGSGSAPHDLLPPLETRLEAAPTRMDRKQFTRLRRGKLTPQARLDLHGMTLDRAHRALIGFLLAAHRDEKRLVLVITGKGKDRDEGGPIPVRQGVLRHNVPQWLSTPPLSRFVLQVVQAHIRHGGGGAYYVYLTRHR